MTKEDVKEINYLVKKIKNDDEEAFTILYKKMYKILFGYLRRFTKNEDIIKDTISSTFLIIIEKSKTKIFYNNCYCWIVSIAKFTILKNLRNIKKEVSIEHYENHLEDLNHKYEIFEEKISFNSLLKKMNSIDKCIVFLKYYCEFKNVQVAKLTHLSLSTLKRRLNNIKLFFKENLKDE